MITARNLVTVKRLLSPPGAPFRLRVSGASFYINSWLEELSLDTTRMQEETLSCESCDVQVTADKMCLCCVCHSIFCKLCFGEHKECPNVAGIDEG